MEPASQLFPSIHLTVDKFHDHCGVFGVYGHPDAAKLAFLGLYALQHRGQESAGIASSDGDNLICKRGMGHVEEIFPKEVLASLPGSHAIGHTRYSTAGDTDLRNAQPLKVSLPQGPGCACAQREPGECHGDTQGIGESRRYIPNH